MRLARYAWFPALLAFAFASLVMGQQSYGPRVELNPTGVTCWGVTNSTTTASTCTTITGPSTFSSSIASGSNGFACTTNGCRVDFGAGASDYASSNGTIVTFEVPIRATTVAGSPQVLLLDSTNSRTNGLACNNDTFTVTNNAAGTMMTVSNGGNLTAVGNITTTGGTLAMNSTGGNGVFCQNAGATSCEFNSGMNDTQVTTTVAAITLQPTVAYTAGDAIVFIENSAGADLLTVRQGGGVGVGTEPNWNSTAPSAPVACTSPTITHGTYTSFQADVGTSCAGVSTFVFTVPATTNGTRCTGDNISASATRVLRQTAGWTGTTITMTNFATVTDIAADFADNADLVIDCIGR